MSFARKKSEAVRLLARGLKRFPGNNRLKSNLAFALFMVRRISEDETERKEAAARCIRLCGEVTAASGDEEQIDEALGILAMLYTETGEYDKALEAIGRLSPARFDSRLIQTAGVLAARQLPDALSVFVEREMLSCWLAMNLMLQRLTAALQEAGRTEKAAAFCGLRQRLLCLFDEGGADFYAVHKLWNIHMAAHLYKGMGDSERCLAEIKQFGAWAVLARQAALADDHHAAKRNSFFADLPTDENCMEAFLSSGFETLPGLLKSFAALLSGREEYGEVCQNVEGLAT